MAEYFIKKLLFHIACVVDVNSCLCVCVMMIVKPPVVLQCMVSSEHFSTFQKLIKIYIKIDHRDKVSEHFVFNI